MIGTMSYHGHASDGDLVRLLDGETEAGAPVEAHVSECAACTARLARFRLYSQRAAAELRAADFPPIDPARIRPPFDRLGLARLRRRRRAAALWSRPELRAAAGLLLLAGVAAASPVGRGWIRDQVARVRDASGQPNQPPREPPRPGAGARVWFAAPAGLELVIRFEAPPAAGTLTLVSADDERASAQVVARGAGEALLVLPGQLHVRNDSASAAHYRVTLPPSVRRVTVHVGPADGSTVIVDVPVAGSRVIDLVRTIPVR